MSIPNLAAFGFDEEYQAVYDMAYRSRSVASDQIRASAASTPCPLVNCNELLGSRATH